MTFRLIVSLLCGCVLLLAGLRFGVAQSPGLVNRDAALNRGLVDWWRGVPGFTHSDRVYNLVRRNDATLVNYGAANTDVLGWNLTDRPGGVTHIATSLSALRYLQSDAAPGFTHTTPFSVCLWAWAAVTQTGRLLMGTNIQGTPFDGIWLQWGDGTAAECLRFVLISTTVSINAVVTATGSLPLTTWVHLCASYDGSQTTAGMTLAINGQMQATTPTSAAFGSFTDRAWHLGTSSDGSTSVMLNGRMDDWRVWARALSPAEITQVYTGSKQGDPDLFFNPQNVLALTPSDVLLRRPPHIYQ